MKNNLLCDNTQYVFYLSQIESVSVHDKKIADQYPINLTENSTVKQDLGFVDINQVIFQ